MGGIFINQILTTNNRYYKNYRIYLCLFFVSISLCLFILFYLFYSSYIRLKQSYKTALLKNKYSISTLYSSNINYTKLQLSNNIFIIGLIEIPKINISYPIIESTNEELLKVSVCRFSGPLPNRIGNLCVAGHNYKNSTMFSKLDNLKINDSIYITDLNNTRLEYIIYDKFIVEENNLDCTQDSKEIEVTLITCYNLDNSKRLVIKAKMKG